METEKSGKKTNSRKRIAEVKAKDPHVAKALRYCRDVLDEKIPACKYVKRACQRQLDDLKKYANDAIFFFDENLAGRICRFIECLPHIEGPKAFERPDGTPNTFELEPWQCFILTTVFGWRRKDTGGRRFRRAYVEVPRGNGKSALSSGIAAYGLTSDAEAGPQVYSAATTREQAAIVFDTTKKMLLKRSDFSGMIGAVVNKHEILCPKNNGRFIPLSREAKSLDGKNLHVGVIDELHAHKTREVYDVLETAMAKRIASLLWIITTAGSDTAGICYEVRGYTIKVLEGAEDDSHFGVIFTIDDGDDWTAEASWVKANPNWGVSIDPVTFVANARKAMQMPAAAANFKTKHLDVWVNADEAAFDMRAWDRCADPDLSETDFEGQECTIGLDLASKIDLAAKVKTFWRFLPKDECSNCGKPSTKHPFAPPGGDGCQATAEQVKAANDPNAKDLHVYAFLSAYVSEDAVEQSRNSQYRGWVDEGRLTSTWGSATDFSLIEQEVVEDSHRFLVRETAYDPAQATQMAQNLMAQGIVVVEIRPTFLNFSEPMKLLDVLMRTGRYHHDGNPVFRWAVSNTVAVKDKKDCVYPGKQRPENKIDPVVAAIMSLGSAIRVSTESPNPYESRGLLST